MLDSVEFPDMQLLMDKLWPLLLRLAVVRPPAMEEWLSVVRFVLHFSSVVPVRARAAKLITICHRLPQTVT